MKRMQEGLERQCHGAQEDFRDAKRGAAEFRTELEREFEVAYKVIWDEVAKHKLVLDELARHMKMSPLDPSCASSVSSTSPRCPRMMAEIAAAHKHHLKSSCSSSESSTSPRCAMMTEEIAAAHKLHLEDQRTRLDVLGPKGPLPKFIPPHCEDT